jgi:undecaprenyl-diphosphatase
VGWGAVGMGLVVSFIVGYASIAWLLKFVANHSLVSFVWYRMLAGLAIIGLLAVGAITAT